MSNKLKITVQSDTELPITAVIANRTGMELHRALDITLDALFEEESPSQLKTELDVVAQYLEKTGTIISIETPSSSWIERVEFDPTTRELVFVSEESRQAFPACFSDFQAALTAESVGKLFWEFKRGQR